MKDNRSELAILRDEWFDSAEGKKCCDYSTLDTPSRQAQFLRNRLERAFLAGALANEKAKEVVAEKLWPTHT